MKRTPAKVISYHKIILVIIIFFTITSSSNAQFVAPLKPGNLWIYFDEVNTDRITVADTSIIIDSLIYTQVNIQHHTSPLIFPRYVRLREDGYYVIRWDSTYQAPNHEQLYYKKNAALGDAWVNPTDDLPLNYAIVDTFPAIVFGQPVIVKELDIDGGVVFFQEFWTEEFGKLTRIDFEPIESLKGCVIDGIVYGDTSFIVLDAEDEGLPVNSFKLAQNYPNPFNSSTRIEYSIKKDGMVNLKIYDLLGREVKTLVNENEPAGSYSVKFNAENLPSGVYIYKLTAGSFSAVKKLMLMK